jgi:hypothetical protein
MVDVFLLVRLNLVYGNTIFKLKMFCFYFIFAYFMDFYIVFRITFLLYKDGPEHTGPMNNLELV